MPPVIGSTRALLPLAFTLLLASCGIGSPVTITDRPLSERVDDRNQTTTSIPFAEDGQPDTAPEAIAFSDALASGNFIRMTVETNSVSTSIRKGPGGSYQELTNLSDGAEVLATGDQTGEWVYVVYGDVEGWVSSRRLVFNSATDIPAVITIRDEEHDGAGTVYEVYGNPSGVNIRSSANGSARLVSGASRGAEVVGTGQTSGGWIEITHNGTTGWAHSNYLRPVG